MHIVVVGSESPTKSITFNFTPKDPQCRKQVILAAMDDEVTTQPARDKREHHDGAETDQDRYGSHCLHATARARIAERFCVSDRVDHQLADPPGSNPSRWSRWPDSGASG